jgi:hypothetical protein
MISSEEVIISVYGGGPMYWYYSDGVRSCASHLVWEAALPIWYKPPIEAIYAYNLLIGFFIANWWWKFDMVIRMIWVFHDGSTWNASSRKIRCWSIVDMSAVLKSCKKNQSRELFNLEWMIHYTWWTISYYKIHIFISDYFIYIWNMNTSMSALGGPV